MANVLADRLEKILYQNPVNVTGIDFIYVYPDQKTLDVYFLHPPTPSAFPKDLLNPLKEKDIQIYNPSGEVKDIPVLNSSWNLKGDVLHLILPKAGDFTLYRFKIQGHDDKVDAFYNDVTFSFKANCPSDLDCEPPEHECPPEEPVDFPIDYLARDFWSFRTALLDFASLKYPNWTDRLEADAGVMMAEVMSSLGDEMAYYQDRVSREAYLETATQRRSLRHHTRLVDYTLHDGLGAMGWLDVTANVNALNKIPFGFDVWAAGSNGQRIDFEVGRGFEYQRKKIDTTHIDYYPVDKRNNEFQPHIWDENQICLPVGTTEWYLEGDQTTHLVFDDFPNDKVPGKWILLKTTPMNPAQPIRKQMVRLIKIEKAHDSLLGTLGTLGTDITHIVWEKEQALPFEFDLKTLVIRGNLVPVTAGKTYTMYFGIGQLQNAEQGALNKALKDVIMPYDTDRAIEREGRNDSISYLFTLPGSEILPLVWLGDDLHMAEPEIKLSEVTFNNMGKETLSDAWQPKRSFIGVNSSESQDKHFVLEDGSWRRVVGYQRIGEEFVHRDYASNNGVTIRFGDGEFGLPPSVNTIFRVDYRLGGGRQSNVAADSLTQIPETAFIDAVTNPLATENGLDAESPNEVRQLAPEAFRAVTYRAVRPEDYAEAAERLDWVQRAGAVFRWTGSWQTAFVTPDPYGAVTLEEAKRKELVEQLDRFRQAGREAYTLDPIYADLDIEIEICAAPSAYAGEVKERVALVLNSKNGYFAPNNFTFGMPLERSTLETVIQNTPGVRAVESIYIRRRGWFDWQIFTDYCYDPGKNVIIRVENDSLHPNRGSLNLKIHGGA
jgi:hypothetical protein